MDRQELRELYENGLYSELSLKIRMYLRGLEMLVNDNESFERWDKLRKLCDEFLDHLDNEVHKNDEVITMEDEEC